MLCSIPQELEIRIKQAEVLMANVDGGIVPEACRLKPMHAVRVEEFRSFLQLLRRTLFERCERCVVYLTVRRLGCYWSTRVNGS